jgi:hypothetical protein
MSNLPRITFGLIVLNGEPFLRYNLRALYPFAHQIVVVEGASPAAASIATPDGHSSDRTLKTLRDFQLNEDPQDKLTIVTAEDDGHPNGFWPGEKHEQSQAYAKRTTGDYLWQVDVDEFYKPEDVSAVLEMLRQDPDITAVSFMMITFWGDFGYVTDGLYLRRGANIYHRLFKWGQGYQYITHRPPTVYNERGVDLRDLTWVSGNEMGKKGIKLYHYSLLFPKQVIEKCEYYRAAKWANSERATIWASNSFMQLKNPYRVHNVYDYPSWLERFTGSHPHQIDNLRKDIASGILEIEMRSTDDVEHLLQSLGYKFGRFLLVLLSLWDQLWNVIKPKLSWMRRFIRSQETEIQY